MLRRNSLARAGAGALLLPAAAALAQTGTQAGTDTQLRMQAIEGSTFLLRSAQLGAQRTQNAQLRQFAQLEAEEQQANMQAMQLAGVAMPAQVAARDDKLRQLQRLEQAQGNDFDQLFLENMVNGHHEALQVMNSLAQAAGNPAERMIGTLNVPAIKSHLAMLQMIGRR
jgi:putative membrane protein